jgi:protein SCO1/2
MFFASCEFACPILVNDMKRIEAALPENARTNVGFVLVSFDCRRDTPAALATYRNVHELGPNWTLLTGGPDDVQELAALLGVKYKKDARGQFAHSNLITLLNKEGEVVVQQSGLNQSPHEIVSAAKRLLPLEGTNAAQPTN